MGKPPAGAALAKDQGSKSSHWTLRWTILTAASIARRFMPSCSLSICHILFRLATCKCVPELRCNARIHFWRGLAEPQAVQDDTHKLVSKALMFAARTGWRIKKD